MSFKFNPLTGNLDLVSQGGGGSPDNFSYLSVDQNATIPEGQQMLVSGHVVVSGHLTILGEIVNIAGRLASEFFYDQININEVVEVQQSRLLLYHGHLSVLGVLRVNGRLADAG